MIITTIILFLIILGFIVFFHELGHFFMAKLYGVKVDEFGIGFPPKIFGFKKGETEYTLNWIPLGGFCKIVGEDGEDKDNPRSFGSKSIFQRFQIISAGVLMNFFMAFVIFSFIFMAGSPMNIDNEDLSSAKSVGQVEVRITNVIKNTPAEISELKLGDTIVSVDDKKIYNIKDLQDAINEKSGEKIVIDILRGKERVTKEIIPSMDFSVMINAVSEDSPASIAGLKTGDKILSVDDKKIYNIKDLQDAINEKKGEKIVFSIIRENENLIKKIIPRKEEVKNEGALGVNLSEGISLAETAIVKFTIFEAIKRGYELTVLFTIFIITAFGGIIQSLLTTGKTAVEVSGPIGIASMTSQAASLGIIAVLNFTALISINLAIINALPFPALDGGRLIFLIVEKIKGSPINQAWEAKVNNMGFMLLMLLMVVVTFKDVAKLDIWGRITALFG
ncbi:MAG: RIP metalloprotease RseP [Candidatus Pacebacteria bacterium]|nr:RIP metalloprotease RseP [Candidatus Paceibacterota bacterium]